MFYAYIYRLLATLKLQFLLLGGLCETFISLLVFRWILISDKKYYHRGRRK